MKRLLMCACLCVSACSNNQPDQDRLLIVSFQQFIITQWNQHVAGSSGTTINVTATSSNGGSVRIVGVTNQVVVYSFDGYNGTAGGGELVLDSVTGDVVQTGDVSGTLTYDSDDTLIVVGELDTQDYGTVDLNGPLVLNTYYNTTDESGGGTVDGRSSVSWGSPESSDSSSGGDCSIQCGKVVGGIEVEGGALPMSCGGCPSGTYLAVLDKSTPGGPFYECMCNGASK